MGAVAGLRSEPRRPDGSSRLPREFDWRLLATVVADRSCAMVGVGRWYAEGQWRVCRHSTRPPAEGETSHRADAVQTSVPQRLAERGCNSALRRAHLSSPKAFSRRETPC